MTEFIEIPGGPLVAGQLTEDDIARAAQMGVRTVINNRPDGEADGQPLSADLEACARSHGMAYHYVPVISGQLTLENVDSFAAAMDGATPPVLAFCRSGTRSTTLWGLSAAKAGADTDDVIARAGEAGYDLGALRPMMKQLADKG